MRIKSNPAAQNTLRHYGENFDRVSQSIRNLSSGKSVMDGTDGGASLYVSKVMQNKVTGLKQAEANTETSISLVQTAEGALADVTEILTSMKQLAVHAANEVTNDLVLLETDQMEIEELLSAIKQKTEMTTFAGKKLLNGSMGINGSVDGDHLRFIEAKIDTPGSPIEGFAIDITQPATQAVMVGNQPLTVEHIEEGIKIMVREGTHVAYLDTTTGDLQLELQKIRKSYLDNPVRFPVDQVNKEIRQIIIHELNKQFQLQGIKLDVILTSENHIKLQHREFGDHPTFSVTCNLPGILCRLADEAENSVPGKDVAGTIGGDPASGHGQLLTARPGTVAQGAVIEYTGEAKSQENPLQKHNSKQSDNNLEQHTVDVDGAVEAEAEGYLYLNQQTQSIQIGASSGEFTQLDLKDIRPSTLATGIKNESEFRSLADIDLSLPGGADDAMDLIDAAYEEVNSARMELGAFQKNTLGNMLENLRTEGDNLRSGISVISDTDAAAEVANMSKNKILLQASQAMLAQANQKPRHVLTLIEKS